MELENEEIVHLQGWRRIDKTYTKHAKQSKLEKLSMNLGKITKVG